jgi:biotin carboxyl carrier protein
VVVEAMKMEHRVTAPHPGTVAEVRVHPGVTVAAGDPLVVLAAEPVPPEGA